MRQVRLTDAASEFDMYPLNVLDTALDVLHDGRLVGVNNKGGTPRIAVWDSAYAGVTDLFHNALRMALEQQVDEDKDARDDHRALRARSSLDPL